MAGTETLYSRLCGMGLSKPYASQIANGHRAPGMKLALRIYKEIGTKLGPLKDATVREIEVAERLSERSAA